MIYAFQADSTSPTPCCMRDIYRLRHRVFVETLGWEDLRKPDRQEKDQFDTVEALHVADVVDGEVLAYSRLLPTTSPHLLSEIYPELLQGRPGPRGPKIWEWTRLCSRHQLGEGNTASIRRLMVAIAELCSHLGASGIIAQSDPGWIKRLKCLGWDARPLAVPVTYHGQPVVALEAHVTSQTAVLSRHRLNVHGDIIAEESLQAMGTERQRLAG